MAEIIINKDPLELSLVDGLENLTTGLGTAKDKSTQNVWTHSGRNADHVTLSARYREDWLSQKVVKIIPQDMTREWRSFDSEEAEEADEEFDIASLFKLAYQWARLYGTAFIVLDINDNRNSDKPVNWNKLKPGCVKSMHVVDRTRIVATGEIEQDPTSANYAMPDKYQFIGLPTPIHKDRLIRFEGTELPIFEMQRNLWYSDSILIPLMDLFDNFHTTSSAAAQMVQEANIDVISISGLANTLQNSKATSALQQRFLDWKSIKSIFGVSILDQTEVYEQKKIQLSGVKDLIWQYLKVVAASVGIPATRFLSSSPDGLNATGQSDLVNYAESLKAMQRNIFKPRLKVIDKLLSIHFGINEEKFKYKFNCVFPESAGERADREDKIADRLVKLVDSGIISNSGALDVAIMEGIVPLGTQVGEKVINNKEGK